MPKNRKRILGIDWDHSSSADLKRKLLYFDQLGVLNLPKMKDALWRDEDLLEEYEWAEEKELIFDAASPSQAFVESAPNARLVSLAGAAQMAFEALSDALSRGVRPNDPMLAAIADNIKTANDSAIGSKISSDEYARSEKAIEFFMGFHWVYRECLARIRAVELSWDGKSEAVSTMGLRSAELVDLLMREGRDAATSKGKTIEVVISNLPLPSDTTPWEQILDFKKDPDSRERLLSLRQWIRDVSTGNIQQFELEEKLEYLLEKYRAHMALHKMKLYGGALQTFVTTTADAIENVVKARVGRIAKGLFEINEKRVALLEAERTAPGREVSYLIKADQTFGAR
jgi:hypothetical protein